MGRAGHFGLILYMQALIFDASFGISSGTPTFHVPIDAAISCPHKQQHVSNTVAETITAHGTVCCLW